MRMQRRESESEVFGLIVIIRRGCGGKWQSDNV